MPSPLFNPIQLPELPTLDAACQGFLPRAPIQHLKEVSAYLDTLCLIHYHMGLVRIVDAYPGIAGLEITPFDHRLANHARVQSRTDLPERQAREATVRAGKELASLRASLPRDRATTEYLSRMGPQKTFLLTSSTAAAYLVQIRPSEIGAWLADNRNEKTLGSHLPTPVSVSGTSRRPRV